MHTLGFSKQLVSTCHSMNFWTHSAHFPPWPCHLVLYPRKSLWPPYPSAKRYLPPRGDHLRSLGSLEGAWRCTGPRSWQAYLRALRAERGAGRGVQQQRSLACFMRTGEGKSVPGLLKVHLRSGQRLVNGMQTTAGQVYVLDAYSILWVLWVSISCFDVAVICRVGIKL